ALDRASVTGIVRRDPPSRRGWASAADHLAVAGRQTGAGDDGSAGILGIVLQRCPQGYARPLSPAPMAGGTDRRAADDKGEAAGAVKLCPTATQIPTCQECRGP